MVLQFCQLLLCARVYDMTAATVLMPLFEKYLQIHRAPKVHACCNDARFRDFQQEFGTDCTSGTAVLTTADPDYKVQQVPKSTDLPS